VIVARKAVYASGMFSDKVVNSCRNAKKASIIAGIRSSLTKQKEAIKYSEKGGTLFLSAHKFAPIIMTAK
jgi:hypothetical protein